MSHDTSHDTSRLHSEQKLVYMANQISRFFATQKEASPSTGTATHIKKFWDPRMLDGIVAYLDRGGAGLEPIAKQAIEIIRDQRKTAA
jgi:formate dehydrogenase subunit delta